MRLVCNEEVRSSSLLRSTIRHYTDIRKLGKDKKIKTLLEKYRFLVGRLNQVNEEINEVWTDEEDMLPGHDEGQEFYAKMEKYKVILAQLEMVREELKRLGYAKV